MNFFYISDNIIYNVSDITAGVFLAGLIIRTILRRPDLPRLSHMLASAELILAGLFIRVSARVIGVLPGNIELGMGMPDLSDTSKVMIWIVSFVFLVLGVFEAANHVIYVNNSSVAEGLATRFAVTCLIAAAGIAAFIFTGSFKVFSAAILIQMIFYIIYLRSSLSVDVAREFGYAALPAMIIFIVALSFSPARFTGFGLTIMLFIINEQYGDHLRQALAEREADLAKSRVQLLMDQISPHYIFNSLQSISGLCDTDPAKASEAINTFSGYLRGSLENLTLESLIPFSRELEHTQAYLELEKIAGDKRFEVECDLRVTDFMLPPLVLQPVVENAVKHGAARAASGSESGMSDATHITIATSEHGGKIYIEVTDFTEGGTEAANNGAEAVNDGADYGIAAGNPKRKSVGLENVRTRLAIQCGGTLEISSFAEGTRVTITLDALKDEGQQ